MYEPFGKSTVKTELPSLPGLIFQVAAASERSETMKSRSCPEGTRRALATGVLKCTVTSGFVLLCTVTCAP